MRGGRAELEKLKAAHVKASIGGVCRCCGYDWPCEQSLLIAALEEALALLTGLYGGHGTRHVLSKLTASQDLRKASSSEPTGRAEDREKEQG